MAIKQDCGDLKKVLDGQVRDEIERRITQGEMIGTIGDKTVSIPVRGVEQPRIVHGINERGGTGQGEGKIGEQIGQDQSGQPGQGEAGDGEGQHIVEVECDIDKIIDLVLENLGLPFLKPVEGGDLEEERVKWKGVRTRGPRGLKYFGRTYKHAILREIKEGIYVPGKPPVIIPGKDIKLKAPVVEYKKQAKAVIMFAMDVSGSMGYEQKQIARTTFSYLDLILSKQYKNGLDRFYIIHDSSARVTDKETFYTTRESGGTKISSAYSLAAQIRDDKYSDSNYNIYFFHATDGDNWGGGDTERCIELLRTDFLKNFNQVASIQIKSAYGSGEFNKDLANEFIGDYDGDYVGGEYLQEGALVLTFIDSKEDIRYTLEGCLMDR